eukprot:TRINITY_DN62381_c0_g2_i1.p1 TRINITY_DN62381_c0_g2~~TRINITY_DN62381_c0_g2_i1.p1  ORF type:complete len:650 (+),score=8.69 TRINITY_DN62381_c0_g2_i1:69-2018(+)
MNSSYAIEPNAYLEPQVGSTGQAATRPLTVTEVFRSTVEKHGDRPCLHLKRPVDGVIPKEWKVWTWNEYYKDCIKFAKAMVHLKVSPFKVVNILGFNSPEWFIANCGSIFAGCIAAGIFATNLPEACEYISKHSKAEIIVVDGNKQLTKYKNVSNSMPHIKAVVVWGEQINPSIADEVGAKVYTFEEFIELGKDVSDDEIETRIAGSKPGNCCTLIYTSGTTGAPKACMLSHDNITWTVKSYLDNYLIMDHTERGISYLPLSHIAAQMMDIHCSIFLGCSVYFAQTDAMKGSIVKTMRDVRPTFFFGVPRVWEKFQEKMMEKGRELSTLQAIISRWAKSVGMAKSHAAQYGINEFVNPCSVFLASFLLKKIKEALGLDECRGCFTGAAPMTVETMNYFASIDIPIYEVYGTSECSGPHTVSAPGNWRVGSCGRELPGTESLIKPDTKELCMKGRHIFMGYMYMKEKTESTFTNDRYLLTGDMASFDKDGFMKIIGRIKELIVTAGGENVPPVLIEDEMKAAMPALSNCMVVGDKRKYLAMLISIRTEIDMDTGLPNDNLAKESLYIGKQIGSNAKTVQEVKNDPLWKQYFDDGMKKGNLKSTSNAQIIRKWALLPKDFSERGGDLTPTLKLKRSVVTKKCEDLINKLYE